jgi:hypothetical protein
VPAYILVKSGERVRANNTAERDALIGKGYVVETDPEQDPRDVEQSTIDETSGKLKLPVKASAPAGPNVVGEMYVATGGVLKICTAAGSPGTWVSVGAQT